MSVLVYSARHILPMTAPPILNGSVAIESGRIRHVGTRAWVMRALAEEGENDPVEVYWPGVIMPGLVNAHTHLQYTDMASVGAGAHDGFAQWAQAFDEFYDAGGNHPAAAAAAGAAQSARFGVTALADVVTDIEAAGALHDAGLRGVVYWEVMNWGNAQWRAQGWQRVSDQLDEIPDTPGVGVSPHAPYSLDTAPLLDVPDLARSRGLRLHIHLGESETEKLENRDERWRSVDAESFQALRRDGYGVSATEFVDQLGVLGPDCHVAHGVYLNDTDRAILRQRGTSVALCPRSNHVIGLDEPPVADYLREGNPIAVGTDSLSSSPSLDVLADVAELYRIARTQGYHEPDLSGRLLAAATLGGAAALGLATGSRRVGQLQVGALADLVAVDVAGPTARDAVEELVRAGTGRQAATVIGGAPRWTSPVWSGPQAAPGAARTAGAGAASMRQNLGEGEAGNDPT